VLLEMICLMMPRISDWISASGLGGIGAGVLPKTDATSAYAHEAYRRNKNSTNGFSGVAVSGSVSFMSNTQRSRVTFDSRATIAMTSWVIEPLDNHSELAE